MVFKPFSHLARRSTKAFAHGYAQSLAAASQSSYASTSTPLGQFNHHRFGKSGTTHYRDGFHTSAIQSTSSTKIGALSPGADSNNDGSLDAYFAAWQRHQPGDEWQQFQFTKRIGWKNPSSPHGKETHKGAPGLRDDVVHHDVAINRAYSTSAVEDLKKHHQDINTATTTVKPDHIGVKDNADRPPIAAKADNPPSITHDDKEEALLEPATRAIELEIDTDSQITRAASPLSSRASEKIALSSYSSTDSNYHAEHISSLECSQKYEEIPVVVESMLRSGFVPSVKAYNSLILSAINLTTASSVVVRKALDVYSDMLRRTVLPDTRTYTLLLELLSIRALEVVDLKLGLEQEKTRFGGTRGKGSFLLHSREAEQEILAEDDSLSIAMRLFDISTGTSHNRSFSAGTYRVLLTACARYGEVDQMIRVYSHMEANKVVPFASVYPPMIRAFATSGDLRSAIECYSEYKNLAIADNSGTLSLLDRADNDVYAAVATSYLLCRKRAGADRFFNKVVGSFGTDASQDDLQAARDTIVLYSFVKERLDTGQFEDALKLLETNPISAEFRAEAIKQIATTAADNSRVEVASQAYKALSGEADVTNSSIAMLAMFIRMGDIASARNIWSTLSTSTKLSHALVEPTAMYAVALIEIGNVDEGLMQARQSFNRIRSASHMPKIQKEASELIDESIELIGYVLAKNGVVPSPEASMSFMWAMIENGGLVAPVAEQLLAGLGLEDILKLSWQDLKLALQVEAGILGQGNGGLNVAHSTRFAYLLETALANRMPLDNRTSELIDLSLNKIGHYRSDLAMQWRDHMHSTSGPGSTSSYLANSNLRSTLSDSFDPYATTLDQRGSTVIIDELEKQGPNSSMNLNEALARFKNIRRAGRHPRYIAYAKLIGAAAKDGRINLVHDLFGLAKQDMPFLAQHLTVKHGWTTILDAMVGACLTAGDRKMATDYHKQLLEMGAVPSANTFGLYITTLKESVKTFDEATEAVRIFHRAKAEGVEPSSFLYNALIGKLGKARRIDDCLFYFAEMQARGIRPTSVTYGTIVNALCRVSDERFAEELFDEMESMPNYKPRPAPYNSMMQFFLTTKRDSSKVLEYYQRMQSRNIRPTMHTYKLLIDTYATLEPINLTAAEGVLETIRSTGQSPEAVHYASLIHANGCVLHNMAGARSIFDDVISKCKARPQACLYQALFESMVANHCVRGTISILKDMSIAGVELTPYIANTLIHGWALEKDIIQAKSVYDSIGMEKREPSTYEAMTRAYLAVEDQDRASNVAYEMLSRGYPSAVSNKILELVGHNLVQASAAVSTAFDKTAPPIGR